MSRKNREAAAEQAAAAASEAARVLQARQQEAIAEKKIEAQPEPTLETEPKVEQIRQPDEKKVKRGNLEREAMLEEIRTKRGETKEAPEEEPKEKVEEPEAPQEAQPAAEVVESAPPEAPKTVRVKVDGEEFDAPADDVESYGGIKPYQIAKANERSLRKNNETLAELKRLMADGFAKPAQPEVPQQSDLEFIKSKLDVRRFGTPEESAAADLEILQRFQSKPVDANAIVNQAVSMVDRRAAAAEFGKSFPDIVSNPLLVRLAVSLEFEEIAKAQKAGQLVDWRKAYSTIGTQIRSAVPVRQSQPAPASQTSGTTSQAQSDKEARKASIVNLPTASARAVLPKEEKQETREESLNRMRKTRGQQTL